MGRLPALGRTLTLGSLLLAPTACDDDKVPASPPAITDRSNSVIATSTAQLKASAAPEREPSAPRRKLCENMQQRPAPKGAISTVSASAGAEPLDENIAFGAGTWVWVNLWAAWCGPCKAEMPMLLEWQKKLRASGTPISLAFVSVDDDSRQLRRFLESQPRGGVRASYWLPEGSTRATFLAALGVKESPDLPVHALINPNGQIACTIQGAVESRDFPQLAVFLGARL